MSPSTALLIAIAKICSEVSSVKPAEELDEGAEGISGIAGLSAAPLLIFTSSAFALPLVTLSSMAFNGSLSPSKDLLTTIAIVCS